jgi:hypothetical protein
LATETNRTAVRRAGYRERRGLHSLHSLAAVSVLFDEPKHRADLEELVSQGFLIVEEVQRKTPVGESLREAVGRTLGSRLIDHWRRLHPEIRRNTRAGKTYSLPAATGLSYEHERSDDDGGRGEPGAQLGIVHPEVEIERRLALECLRRVERREQLQDPRFVGPVFFGVPSHRALPTARAEEFFADLQAERKDRFNL